MKKYDIKTTDKETLRKWFYLMTLGRAIDEKAPSYLLQSLGWSYHAPYAGHDGIQLAMGQVFDKDTDFLFPYYRDMLTVLSAGMTAEEIILNGISKATDLTSGGRHMSNHFSKMEWHIENVSSATATHDLHAAGVARAMVYYGQKGVAITSHGESAASEGYVYEAINGASNERLPVIFVFQDNGYGISVPKKDQTANRKVADNFSGFKNLRIISGREFVLASNLIEATPDTGSTVMYSSALKRMAVKLSKICNDLRLLSSGPRCGLNEINLPPMQPGSSIMPGKVNPVIPEVVNQICYRIIGNDLTVTFAAEAGQLQLNVMEPVIVHAIFSSIKMLQKGMERLRILCVEGITANIQHCREMVLNSIGIVTALNPTLGYENSSRIAKRALKENRSVYDLVLEEKLLTKEELDQLLKPELMIKPHKFYKKNKFALFVKRG